MSWFFGKPFDLLNVTGTNEKNGSGHDAEHVLRVTKGMAAGNIPQQFKLGASVEQDSSHSVDCKSDESEDLSEAKLGGAANQKTAVTEQKPKEIVLVQTELAEMEARYAARLLVLMEIVKSIRSDPIVQGELSEEERGLLQTTQHILNRMESAHTKTAGELQKAMAMSETLAGGCVASVIESIVVLLSSGIYSQYCALLNEFKPLVVKYTKAVPAAREALQHPLVNGLSVSPLIIQPIQYLAGMQLLIIRQLKLLAKETDAEQEIISLEASSRLIKAAVNDVNLSARKEESTMIKDHLAARTSLGNSLSVALQSNKHKKLKHIECGCCGAAGRIQKSCGTAHVCQLGKCGENTREAPNILEGTGEEMREEMREPMSPPASSEGPSSPQLVFHPRQHIQELKEIFEKYTEPDRHLEIGPKLVAAITEVSLKLAGSRLDVTAICKDAETELRSHPDFEGFLEIMDIVRTLLELYTL